MNKKTNSGLKIICLNRKASFNYFFEDLLEAGIVLKGSEIKSIREGKVNIADSYAVEKDGLTIVPTKMYFKKGKAKIELAVAKGKKLHDKRASKKDRDWNRDKSRYFRKSS